MFKYLSILILLISLDAKEPISPIPLDSGVNLEKAKLGEELFFDTILSKDYSTACINCHNIYHGGADKRNVSIGFNGREGNIQSPTVFNARYNFQQFWNGRAKDLMAQVDGPLQNPVEHDTNPNMVETRLNKSSDYKKKFKKVYYTSDITYQMVKDAIVEFEKALITPNAKIDKYLRSEVKLSKDEEKGYQLFKQYGCVTCHNGINIGGNSFQKMGLFIKYTSDKNYPDLKEITHNKNHKNVFKVPTLRNIELTAPYFHDASASNRRYR